MSDRKAHFNLFVKSPVEDEKAFCAAAKKYNILIVPGSSFGCPGYVRIAYCVAYETIVIHCRNLKNLPENINSKNVKSHVREKRQ